MNTKFTYLSNKLYQVALYRYQSKKRNQDIIFDQIRMKQFGRNKLSYTGRGESYPITAMVKNYIDNEGTTNKLFHNLQIYRSKVDDKIALKNRTLTSNHIFLKVIDKNNKTLIIDPTYKQFLYKCNGHVEKWFSPYMQHLFDLDPVFIGTELELEKLLSDLEIKRGNDRYHCDDDLIKDRYSDINIEQYDFSEKFLAAMVEKWED